MQTCIDVVALSVIVNALKATAKTKVLKNAVKKVSKGEFVSGYITLAGNGKLISSTVFERCDIAFDMSGVVIAQFGKEILFNNVDELIEAEQSALAIYHYRQSFNDYRCSAGI